MNRRDIFLLVSGVGLVTVWTPLIGLTVGQHLSNVGNPIGWRIGAISQLMTPYSWCLRCKTTWGFVKGHSTMLTADSGTFPLCEGCWRDLTPQERLPYYRALRDKWIEQMPPGYDRDYIQPWEVWERAVLNE